MKLCCRCKKTKLLAEFGVCNSNKDGLNRRCRSCHREGVYASHLKTVARNLSAGFQATPKACVRCGEITPVAGFHSNKANPDGLSGICKFCAIKSARKHYHDDPARHYASSRAWTKANPKAARGYKQEWKNKNREYTRRAGREYMAQKRPWLKAVHLKRMQEDPEYAAHKRMIGRRSRSKRRAMEKGSYSAGEWLLLCSMADGKCLRCGKPKTLTVDHVMPIIMGGSNYRHNLQPLCLSCNVSKGARFMDYRPWTMDSDEIGLGA